MSPPEDLRLPHHARKLRVAVFSDAIYGRNGVGFYYKDLSEHIDSRTERAVLFCPGAPSDVGKLERFSLPMPGDKTQKLYWPRAKTIAAAYRRLRPHVTVVATPAPFGFLGTRLAKRHGSALCAAFHTDFESLADIYWNKYTAAPSMKFLEWLHCHLFCPSQIVATMSDNMIEQAKRCGAREVRIVGTTIEKAFLDAPIRRYEGELKSVLFAGRLAKEKNIEAILEAAAQLPKITFIIAGDGPLRPEVEAAAARCPNIDYRGWVSHDDLRDLMDAADMLLLPSHVESFGTVALEAMARERLVLVSENCGIRDWPALSKPLVTMAATESLATTLRRAQAESTEERLDRAHTGRAAVQGFVDKSLGQWLAIFRDTLDKHHLERS